jgi:hypothetical protein
MGRLDWILLIAAGLVILASFLWNAGPVAAGGRPGPYPWWLFLAGWMAGMGVFLRAGRRSS